MFAGGSCLTKCLSKLESFGDWFNWLDSNCWTLRFKFFSYLFCWISLIQANPPGCWGKFFPSCFFVFSLTCLGVFFFFWLRYFVNYTPFLCVVWKFRYGLFPRPYFIASFYGAISVRSFHRSRFFPRWPWPPTLFSSAFGKQLCFHRLFIYFAVALK